MADLGAFLLTFPQKNSIKSATSFGTPDTLGEGERKFYEITNFNNTGSGEFIFGGSCF
jgi:hypothetical protein